jgi:NAD-dependent protein deacetylase/lipoamidase
MAYTLPTRLAERLSQLGAGGGNLVVLTGAGISAESGIPTFRGADGYWVVGSKTYHPQEIATHDMFIRNPEAVWAWYLSRRAVCHAAEPNPGHEAVVELETLFGERFRLITQNVDGLHLRAGSTLERTYQIHGNLDYARCDVECGQPVWSLPETLVLTQSQGTHLPAGMADRLRCPRCHAWARPHVLWFDEYYDEEHYRYDSSIRAATSAEVLLVVGTSGATRLPMQVGHLASEAGALMIDVNIEANPFSRLAETQGGFFLKGPSAMVLPGIVSAL